MRIFNLLLMAALISVTAFAGDKTMSPEEKTYTVLLMNVTDEFAYQDYEKKVLPIFRRYGGVVERELDLMGSAQGTNTDVGPFNRALVLYYSSDEKAQALNQDETYRSLRTEFERSLGGVAVYIGRAVPDQVGNDTNRMYMVKVSHFNDETAGREAAYASIDRQAAKLGIHQERRLVPVRAMNVAQADEVAVYFMDSPDAHQKLMENKSLVSEIESFNQKYLSGYTFFVGKIRSAVTETKAAMTNEVSDPWARRFTDAPLRVSRTVALNADQQTIFELISTHSNLTDWFPNLHEVRIDNTEAEVEDRLGCVRICKFGNFEVKEKIVYWEEGVGYAFSLPEDNAFGVSGQVGVFHVADAGSGRSRLTWSLYFNHPNAEMLSANHDKVMVRVIEGFVKTYGGELAVN